MRAKEMAKSHQKSAQASSSRRKARRRLELPHTVGGGIRLSEEIITWSGKLSLSSWGSRRGSDGKEV